MCGIFGAISRGNIYEEMKAALERLSYRGYDSAGIAALVGAEFDLTKCVGHPEALEEKGLHSNVAIGHNRWATHGAPSTKNAHPHSSNDKKIMLVHNGIIENHIELKDKLIKLGFNFYSDTDTEIIPNLIQHYYDKTEDLRLAVSLASKSMQGAYAVVFIHKDFPDNIFIVKLGSPICVGLSDGAAYISSDINSLPISTKKAVALEDGRFIQINKDGEVKSYCLKGKGRDLKFEDIDVSRTHYDLGNFSSYLEKEIFEQPIYAKNVIAGRVIPQDGEIRLSGIAKDIENILDADELIFTGCGSAFLVAQIGAHIMETIARKRCRAIPAGELKYFNAVLGKKTVMLAVSQSGETADTLGCIRVAKNHGALTVGVVNVPNSSIAREVSSGIHIRAGQEVSVASTKAVTNQVISLISLAGLIASKRDLSLRAYKNLVLDIYEIPSIIERTVALSEKIKFCAEYCKDASSIICIGRDVLEPVAKEAALKIKEVSYIHAEGYSASELKHGPLALIDEAVPTFAFGSSELLEDKLLANIMEIKSRRGPVIGIFDDGCSKALVDSCDHSIILPKTRLSYTSVVPRLVVGQLLALYLAELNGKPVDRPRNLAKSVTVE